MKLSIVTTMYHSFPHLQEFYERIKKSAEKITGDYEIIFVDDGSPDKSLDTAVQFHQDDSRVKVIELSRNFGHHKAMMCGLEHAKGEFIFLIDCDLEESPELLNQFWQELNSKSYDVVYGVQNARKGGFFERITGKAYYKLFNSLSSDGIKTIENICTVRLVKKAVVDAMSLCVDNEFYFSPISSFVGFKQAFIKIQKKSTSETTYRLSKKINMMLNSIINFSKKPLFFIFYLGVAVTIGSFVFGAYLVYQKVFLHVGVAGWSAIMCSIFLSLGVIMFALGLIAIYIANMFYNVKNRPFTIVRTKWEGDSR